MGILREIYFSLDVESDGPIPGPYSMLSFGVAAFDEDGKLVGTFSRNLDLLENTRGDPATMAWWKDQLAAWEACRRHPVPPKVAMGEFVEWVGTVCKAYGPAIPVCMASPAGYDFTFLYWYIMNFVGESPFSHSCLDIKTYAMATLGIPFRRCRKRDYPSAWFGEERHTHVALDDALEQGHMFFRMRRQNLGA